MPNVMHSYGALSFEYGTERRIYRHKRCLMTQMVLEHHQQIYGCFLSFGWSLDLLFR